MPPVDDAPPSHKYRLVAEIGRGGMADVFLAVAQGPAGFNKLVVLKKARVELAQDPEFLAMFLDEARLSARLNHPNVVQTSQVGHDGDRYFIAMEYLDGQPLHRIRARAGAAGFPVDLQVRVLIDTLNGLHHAHELSDFDGSPLSIVHRDATPQNVFVTYDGQIKVVDFGIAKAVDSSSETRTGVVKGKVPYLAPEQARGESIDRRADVFAVGVMLWEAITGHRMWKGLTDIVILVKLAQGQIPSLHEAAPHADPELAAICARAVAATAEDRYPTAAALARALEAWLARQPEPITARDVGAYVAERFVEDRVKVKGLIEAQLHDVRWSGSYPRVTGRELPRIEAAPGATTPTGARPTAVVLGGGRGTGQSATSLTAAAAGDTRVERRPPPRVPIVAIGIGASVVAIAVVVVGVRLFVGAPPPAPAVVVATDATQPMPSADASRALDPIRLKVRVSPPRARLFLDDAPLATGAYEGTLPRDGSAHRIRAEAPGFTSREETITADDDALLAVSLERATTSPAPNRQRAAGDRSTPSAAPLGPESPPAEPRIAPGQKPKRAIDSDSPYAK